MSMMLVLAVTAAVAASMGYMAARKKGDGAPPEGDDRDREDERDREDDRDEKKEQKKKEEKKRDAAPPKKKPAADPKTLFEELPLALGDVVMAEGGERWLAGAVIAKEQSRVLGALFLAPEGSSQHAIVCFAAPQRHIYWLTPSELTSPDEPPATIELGTTMFRRRARIPVSLTRLGQGVPELHEEGLWAVYDGGGRDVAMVLTSGGRVMAYKGVRLDEGEFDRLGGGGDG